MAFDLYQVFKWATSTETSFDAKTGSIQDTNLSGRLFAVDLEKARQECKSKVARISKECRANNRLFRDAEFDIEDDREACLHGLSTPENDRFLPSDVQRVSQIFDNPQFFLKDSQSDGVTQGRWAHWWFLSALTSVASASLLETFCVARDEEVGVYGFVFHRDAGWVVVIIDDFLCTDIPKFEELHEDERQLYHNDKDKYNQSARKGGKSLYFSNSSNPNETWVPLVEKAFAKLHGDYASLNVGFTREAIEDLTGGVSTYINIRDVFDADRFWNDELIHANRGRLLICSFNTLDSIRSGQAATISGLRGHHCYSILRAIECHGKRFVVLRDPLGDSRWTGPWSDGSKEWTAEWLARLPELGHNFKADGQFIMQYKDFLSTWDYVDRVLLIDSTWTVSSHWLCVTPRAYPSARSYGDVSFTISLPSPSRTLIALSQPDTRYFKALEGRYKWSLDFVLFKKGQTESLGSSNTKLYPRNTTLETDLDAGDYVVRLYPFKSYDYIEPHNDSYPHDLLKLSKVLTERAKCHSLASNCKAHSVTQTHLPIDLDLLAGHDLDALQQKDIKAKLPRPDSKGPDYSSPSHILNSNCVVVGLQVYTAKDSPAVLAGQLTHDSP